MESTPATDFLALGLKVYAPGPDAEAELEDILDLFQRTKKKRLKIKGKSPEDSVLESCVDFEIALELLRNRRKQSDPNQNLPSPEDLLLAKAKENGAISDDILRLVLKKPIHTIRFDQKHLKNFEDVETRSLQSESSKVPPSSLTLASPFRFAIEIGLIVFLLFLMMWIIPQIRTVYENSIQSQINEYLIENTLIDSPPPPGMARPEPSIAPLPDTVATTSTPSEPVPNESETPVSSPSKKQPKPRDGETWRFSFSAQASVPLEEETLKVIQTRLKEKIKPSVVPGGVQYAFDLPTTDLISLKLDFEQLIQALQRKAQVDDPNMAVPAVNLSWYKKQGMNRQSPPPPGHVKVIIWLSMLN